MDLPRLNDTAEKAKEQAKGKLISWLPRFECPKCNVACEAGYRYDPDTAAFHAETNGEVPAWICPQCDSAYRREENSLTASFWG